MKVIINITKFIAMIILTLCLLFFCEKNIVRSTILNKQYVLQKLDETNFYSKTYEIVENNFENYIEQSGLEKTVLESICTREKVKRDINIIISNIYDGTNEEVDTTEIEEKLNSNIDNQNVRTSKNENAIDEFVKHICESYKDSIINTKYESTINNAYKKIMITIEKINKIVITITIITIILLIIMNIRNIIRLMANIATILLSTSLLQFIFIFTLKAKVDIADIKAFNEAFSITIVTIIKDILSKVNLTGIIILIVSIVLIIAYESVIYYRTLKNGKRVKE